VKQDEEKSIDYWHSSPGSHCGYRICGSGIRGERLTNRCGIPDHTSQQTGALIRLLLVQDEAKADAYIAQAVQAGKITADQAVKVKDFWTAHHKQFAWNFMLRRLLRAQDENNVKTYLDKAVANGKLTQVQEDKVIAIWKFYTPRLRQRRRKISSE